MAKLIKIGVTNRTCQQNLSLRQAWHRVWPQNSSRGILSPCSWNVSSHTRHSRMLDFLAGEEWLCLTASPVLCEAPWLWVTEALEDRGTSLPSSSIRGQSLLAFNVKIDSYVVVYDLLYICTALRLAPLVSWRGSAVSPLTLFTDDIDSVHFRYCDKEKCRWRERVLVGVWPVSGWLRVSGPAGRGMCGEQRRLLSVGRTLAMPTAGASWIQVSHHLPSNVPNDLGQLWQWHRVYEPSVTSSEWLLSMTSNPLVECGPHKSATQLLSQYSWQCLSLDSCLGPGGPAR